MLPDFFLHTLLMLKVFNFASFFYGSNLHNKVVLTQPVVSDVLAY